MIWCQSSFTATDCTLMLRLAMNIFVMKAKFWMEERNTNYCKTYQISRKPRLNTVEANKPLSFNHFWKPAKIKCKHYVWCTQPNLGFLVCSPTFVGVSLAKPRLVMGLVKSSHLTKMTSFHTKLSKEVLEKLSISPTQFSQCMMDRWQLAFVAQIQIPTGHVPT